MRRVALPLLVIAWLTGTSFAQTPVPVPVEGSPPQDPQPYPEPVNESEAQPKPLEPPQVEKKVEAALDNESQEIRQIIVEDNTKTTSATVQPAASDGDNQLFSSSPVSISSSRSSSATRSVRMSIAA